MHARELQRVCSWRSLFSRSSPPLLNASGFSTTVASRSASARRFKNCPTPEKFPPANLTGAAARRKSPGGEEIFLAFDVDLNHSGQIRSTTADLQIEFGAETVRIYSWLGYADFFYPQDRFAPFNRPELEPLWGAWSAEILFIAAVSAVIALILSWWILAAIYFPAVWILGYLSNRDLNFRASWKLSGAALMPGALLMTAGILLYDFGFLNLVSFGFVFRVAFYASAGFICSISLFFLPAANISGPNRPEANPFKPRKLNCHNRCATLAFALMSKLPFELPSGAALSAAKTDFRFHHHAHFHPRRRARRRGFDHRHQRDERLRPRFARKNPRLQRAPENFPARHARCKITRT